MLGSLNVSSWPFRNRKSSRLSPRVCCEELQKVLNRTSPMKRFLAPILLLILLFPIFAIAANSEEITGVPHIIDGDSIRIADVEIRLRRIDAPEGKQTCRYQGNDWACGQPLAGV